MLFLARAFSVLLHPLLMPLLTIWLALSVDPQLGYFLPNSRWLLYTMLGIMTVAFPITSALLLMRAGVLSSLEMPTRQERIAPYVMTLMYFGMAYYLLHRTPLHPAVDALFIGILCALAATLLITFWWKISAHMVGIGGVIGAMLGLSILHGLPLLPLLALLVICAGLLGTARLLSSDHTQGQIIAGVALGWCCTQGALLLGLII
ncbi:MAG TPA: hypothetical protein PLV08_00535 [Flavobacteriales bacterium]|nr:hypothetical protein [Flavobacteriales bacterium]MBK6552217.1 hypothetical protein [Flavobacteriales bacterium]MBK7113690.1 hypothetical protein [Flavobacteriales bacterium]MBK7482332.1 hypothetical protein [Flavobacteriales bacterium]MBK7619918.1 hypothetical protein [Flavobacteriales bacterium]